MSKSLPCGSGRKLLSKIFRDAWLLQATFILPLVTPCRAQMLLTMTRDMMRPPISQRYESPSGIGPGTVLAATMQ